ncbi:MAG: hypothetical protein COU08_02705 [Candidatus Harrisonbacteria bacterium CG10_big_fil_rev_8_21_14_0_10_42_17]|uniref:SIMPL domain-containing protein n=1 Tax=Candidatus Harrisonbacteria bacterium CG10_big_fil_rev_8_21_14_0_10_42_17 TaxID=1974584 RepID=A0A2M6WHX5_9BACT|nr:MAG: hypothetical protein COU08_02705 [Candidatus Harrisonbacteria bacterium CG10_big_fil_rev_8_21_14_0_10_42_17]
MNNKEQAKSVFWWLLNVTLIVVILLGLGAFKVLRSEDASRPPARTISVSGEGEVVAIPDIARLDFSVVSDGQDPKKLQEDNVLKINAAIDFIKEQGVKKEDIKTSQFSLYPKYDYDRFSGRSTVFGYTLTQSVTIKIRDFENISPILSKLPQVGINQIGSISFEVDDPETYLADAREKAFDKAREKAESMARQNGVRLGKVVTFNDNSYGYPVYRYEDAAFGKEGAVAESAPAPTIEPGSQDIKVNVNVVYEIK